MARGPTKLEALAQSICAYIKKSKKEKEASEAHLPLHAQLSIHVSITVQCVGQSFCTHSHRSSSFIFLVFSNLNLSLAIDFL